MLDVDGTIIKYDYDALPTSKVIKAIKKAQEILTVCLVTGRSYGYIEDILKKLKIDSGFAIVNNGANVYDLSKKRVIYDRPIEHKEAVKIVNILIKANISFYVKKSFDDTPIEDGYFTKSKLLDKAYMIFTEEKFSLEKVEYLLDQLKHLSKTNAHKGRHKDPDKFGLNISHVNATKLNGVIAVEKELKIDRSEMIGVGDAYNDFPLLMACGLKVAMGNAVPDLKAIADYVAPSVEDDGVVDVIEKFVLKNEKFN